MIDLRRGSILLMTFVVAFCSIVYELIYSELLRVIFGGTVLRYSITIGLFLFSFGIGSMMYSRVKDGDTGFMKVEVALSVIGPLGLVFIMVMNGFPQSDLFIFNHSIPLYVSHVPIIAVGMLSGLELPYLTSMLGGDDESDFPVALAFDYFGSLVGSILYAVFMYPRAGLIGTVFVIALWNAVVVIIYYEVTNPKKGRILALTAVLIMASCMGVIMNQKQVENELEGIYLEGQYESDYPSGSMNIEITNHKRTKYQNVVMYNRTWNGERSSAPGSMGTEKCMRIGEMIQLCDSWVKNYHSGLVDAPMTMYDNQSEMNVLVLGGGDWIAINHLQKYGANITHVDIDREFAEWTKQNDYTRQYNNESWKYENLTNVHMDAYAYLRQTDQKYDMVVMDLPGIRSDKLLSLYSTEFYSQLNSHLTDRGKVVTWEYYGNVWPQHHQSYINTINEAGFDSMIRYYAWDDADKDGRPQRGEKFYILSPKDNPKSSFEPQRTSYTEKYAEKYNRTRWETVPWYRGVEPNSIFDPNYDIIIDE